MISIRSLSTAILFTGVLVSQASASSAFGTRNVLSHLLVRQTGLTDVPTQCQSSCNTIYATIQSCTTTACLCSTANANLLEACVDCIVNIDPTAALIASGQGVLDEFNASCNGQSVPSLTVSVTGAVATGSSAASTAVASGSKSTPLATSSTVATLTTTSRISQITITQGPTTSSTSPASTTSSSTGFSSTAFGLKETRNGIWGVSIGVVAGMALAWV